MTPLEVAKLFLKKGPPYYGTSDWKDSKLLGRKEGGAGGFFDGTKKQFYAKSNDVLVALLKTEKWKPVDAVCVSVVLKLIREAEKADAKKQKLQSERVEQPERAQTAEDIDWLRDKTGVYGGSELSEEAAAEFFEKQIYIALYTKTTQLNNAVHILAHS